MSEIVLYGIENCDQVRRARAWLRAHALEARFHDFRRDGLDRETLERWLSHVPWDSLLNRRGLAWRRLAADERANIVDRESAVEAMLKTPVLVRRPVVEAGPHLLVGFSEATWAGALGVEAA
jgi:arsenate reductase (glutaredoxin)